MAEEKPFRVLLDLSELNLNASKYVWMNVSPRELNNIADFKNSVLKKLNFDRRDVKLFVHDGLLPEDEKIIILRENDTVKIQYEDSSSGVNCSSSFCEFNSSRISSSGRSSGDYNGKRTEKGPSRKRKRKSEIDVSDAVEGSNESFHKSHNKKKKHKRSHSTSPTEEKTSEEKASEEIIPEIRINGSEIENISIETQAVQNNETENTYNISNSEPELLEAPLDSIKDDSVAQGSNCKKRKRKRHKKRKNEPNAVESLVPYVFSLSEKQVKNTTSTSFSDKFSSIRKHIRFTSPTPSLDATNEDNVEVADLSSCVKNFKPESALEVSDAYKTPDSPLDKTILSHKNSTPSSQTYIKQNSWNVSPMQDETSIRSEQPSYVENKETRGVKKNVKRPYSDCLTLNSLPPIGTHIAFKTLELDENYSPSVTPYKEGIVRKIDPTTEAMEIELVEVEIKPGRVGKFENLAEDEVPGSQVIRSVTLNWSSLIEPRWITD